MKVATLLVAHKGDGAAFSTFPVFWSWRSDRHLLFDGLIVIRPRAPKIQDIPGISPLMDYFSKSQYAKKHHHTDMRPHTCMVKQSNTVRVSLNIDSNTGMCIRFGKPICKKRPYAYSFLEIKTKYAWLPCTKNHPCKVFLKQYTKYNICFRTISTDNDIFTQFILLISW